MPARNYFTQQFNFFNQIDTPTILLCNPNRDKLYSLTGVAHEVKLTLKFNAISELSFKFPKSIDKINNLEAYNYIKVKRLILLQNVGYFLIVSSTEINDGSVPYLQVECKSIEMELSFKKVIGINGTFPLFDPIHPTSTDVGTNLLGYLVSLAPTWSIGGVDSTIANLYRTFDISDTTMYDFMINEMEKAYGCIFTFDLIDKKIYVDAIENATTSTDIFLSYDNLIKSSEFNEISDEIVTALSVYGGNDLDIRAVNPLGTNYIYNFNYYKTLDWMSQGLITSINSWESKIASNQNAYANLLTALRQANVELSELETTLNTYENEYATLEIGLKVAIENNNSGNINYYRNAMSNKQGQINQSNALISTKKVQIANIKAGIVSINNVLSFSNNFTQSQLLELSNYIIQNTYQNENIIVTDKMKLSEVQDNQQQLYNQAVQVLGRVSVPRYEFSVDSANFVALKEFEIFTNQIVMGSVIKIDTEKDYQVNAVLLGLEITYDNLNDFKLTFSNRLRLDNGAYQYTDLANQVVRTGSSVSFNSQLWSNWSEYKSEVTTFIDSALNTTKNELINSTNQEIKINGSGLRGRRWNGSSFDGGEVWLTSNVLAFTDDNWQTSKTALGKITVNGVSKFGLVGEALIGNLIAGNNLIISNKTPLGIETFRVDQNGASITNGKFTISKDYNGTINTISLDPSTGFTITSGGETLFSASMNNTVEFSGTFKSNDPSNNIIIRSDGTAKIGLLTINKNSATFNGKIYAANLDGVIGDAQISGVSGAKVGSGYPANFVGGGTMSDVNLSGEKGSISVVGTDTMDISSGGDMMIRSNGGYVAINSETTADVVLSQNSYISAGGDGNRIVTRDWANSNFYSYGDSPSFTTVKASSHYEVQGYSGVPSAGSTSYNLRRADGGTVWLIVRGGIVTAFGT